MKRNKRLLLKTAKRIERFPESYDQATWAGKSNTAPCGTVACLAGEIVICSERTVKKGIAKLFDLDVKGSPGVSGYAEAVAGIAEWESQYLFFDVDSWPKPFGANYLRAKTRRGRARAAAALLRYLANGGEVFID
jgi:hypothetical protein